MIRAEDIHARISWPAVLEQLGIDPAFLRKRHGPCAICGGKDRFRFDDYQGRGNWICNRCGAGDGFSLLMKVHGWSFSEARKRVIEAAGLCIATPARTTQDVTGTIRGTPPAVPTSRVIALLRASCAIPDCADAIAYLESRHLWPLPQGCTLRAHAAADYFEEGKHIGRFPAILAPVHDHSGELVTCHITYLRDGKKLTEHEPRKILSPLTGRQGCAVQLMPLASNTMGIAEGVETAIAAAILERVPVWAGLNTSLLVSFVPPQGVTSLRIYADRDGPGLLAAAQLMERLQESGVRFELRVPAAPAKDWNDVLMAKDGQAIG